VANGEYQDGGYTTVLLTALRPRKTSTAGTQTLHTVDSDGSFKFLDDVESGNRESDGVAGTGACDAIQFVQGGAPEAAGPSVLFSLMQESVV